MKQEKRVLAFDFGASGGRAILGIFNGEAIALLEVHRFSNDPVEINGTLYWDTLRQFYEIKQGLTKAKLAGEFDSVGIDTWGVDFGLLDKDGFLLENAVHYRDRRTAGMLEESFKALPRERFYQITGNQFMELNTAFQLYALKRQRPALLNRAETLLFTPDLLNYFLTGVKSSEYTIASTSQLLNAENGIWSPEVLDALEIPRRLFTAIVPPKTVVGRLQPRLCEELGLPAAEVISVASHDTQSAVAAVPAEEEDFLFLSCGTWSLMGTELSSPIINTQSEAMNITNEGGVDGTVTFLKNIIGLWLIQESRRQWQREGSDFSYAELEKLALAAAPLQSFIDPDAPEFVPQGNIPQRVREFCRKTGQAVPESVGEVMRCIYQSLALKYRFALEQIESCTGKRYKTIYIVGGGVKDTLLCRMTAGACNRPVSAGPIEATVLGNIAVQLMAAGKIKDLREARRVIARSSSVTRYLPEDAEQWEEAYSRFQKIL